MNPYQKSKYLAKSKDSFKTKKNLFLFSLAIHQKDSFSTSDFIDFQISEDLVNSYSAEYWQELESFPINGIIIKDLVLAICALEKAYAELLKELEKEYINSFPNIFPEEYFVKLIGDQEEEIHCHYCNLTKAEIELLVDKRKLFKKSLRGWSFEIDRLNSNYEYRPENCVMACYWCNNAKTDEFTETEFLKIGKVIHEIWQERLK